MKNWKFCFFCYYVFFSLIYVNAAVISFMKYTNYTETNSINNWSTCVCVVVVSVLDIGHSFNMKCRCYVDFHPRTCCAFFPVFVLYIKGGCYWQWWNCSWSKISWLCIYESFKFFFFFFVILLREGLGWVPKRKG